MVPLRLMLILCLLLVGIGVFLALMGRAPPVEPLENETIPHLSIELINFSWGVQAEVTIDPWGENGWTWDNPLFDPSISHLRMDFAAPDICSSFGHGIAMKNKSVMYWNITDPFCCDACLCGVYAVVTNGSCWVVAKIMEDSGDLPVETGLDFSLEFRDGLVVYVRSPDGDLPEIDSLCIGSEILYWGGQEVGGGCADTAILYRNETTLWCEPLQVSSRRTRDQIAGNLNASVLWFCRALGRDGTMYWNPISLAHFGVPPPVYMQPEDWP